MERVGWAVGTLGSKRLSNLIFAGLFGISLVLFYRIILPFLMPVLLAAFLAVLFQPVHRFALGRLGLRRSMAAGLCTALVVAAILVPLVVVGFFVARELLGVAAAIQSFLEKADLQAEMLAQIPPGLRRYVHVDPAQGLEKAVMSLIAGSAGLLSDLLSTGTELLVDAFLMTVAMYYFFLDGQRLVAEGARLLPIDPRYFRAFVKEFQDVAHAMIYGNTLTAVLQGVTGLVGFLIAGVPNAALWSSAMVLVAFLPVGGTLLVWGPIGVSLIVGHHLPQGLFVLGWGAFMVGALDNMIRPRICGTKMTLHPLLVFLSMFGGISVFGMMGLLVGPLIASLFMAMVRIYRQDFLHLRPPPPPVEEVAPEPVRDDMVVAPVLPTIGHT